MAATLKSRFPMIIAELRPRMEAALAESAEEIAGTAKGLVHVDSGDLRDSIHVERVGTMEYSVLGGDEDVFYGHLEEFGTTHSPAHPFLIPAAEAELPATIARASAALKRL